MNNRLDTFNDYTVYTKMIWRPPVYHCVKYSMYGQIYVYRTMVIKILHNLEINGEIILKLPTVNPCPGSRFVD